MKKTLAIFGVVATLGAGGTVAVDAQINPYTDRQTHYELDIVSEIEQGERVEIAKDRAEMTLKGWNDEYAIKIIPQIPTTQLGAIDRPFIKTANRPLLSKRMEFREGGVTAFIEPKTENEFDIDFTLHSKPDTNVFEYKIAGAEDFDFFYQPELTLEEMAEGGERPENVTGSYAVYHKTKANHRVGSTNYATGKVLHIYRPKAIDTNGAEVWAELSYDSGTLSVIVSQKFLDEAVYPVRIDPTFGYTACGATVSSAVAQNPNVSQRLGRGFSLSENGTLDSIHACLKANTSATTVDHTAYVNTENTATDSHTQVSGIEQLELSISTTATFYTFTASSEALTSANYVLNVLGNGEDTGSSAENVFLAHDTGASGNIYFESVAAAGSYTTLKESPWTETDASATTFRSIYATYTATAAATSPNIQSYQLIFEE